MNGNGGGIPRRRIDRGVITLDATGGRRGHGAAVSGVSTTTAATIAMSAGTNQRTTDVVAASLVFRIVRGARLCRVSNAIVVVMNGGVGGCAATFGATTSAVFSSPFRVATSATSTATM